MKRLNLSKQDKPQSILVDWYPPISYQSPREGCQNHGKLLVFQVAATVKKRTCVYQPKIVIETTIFGIKVSTAMQRKDCNYKSSF